MTHDIGQTAKSFVDALKDQPLSLALVAMNLGLLGFLYFVAAQQSEERKHDTELLYQNRKEVGDLLSRCTMK